MTRFGLHGGGAALAALFAAGLLLAPGAARAGGLDDADLSKILEKKQDEARQKHEEKKGEKKAQQDAPPGQPQGQPGPDLSGGAGLDAGALLWQALGGLRTDIDPGMEPALPPPPSPLDLLILDNLLPPDDPPIPDVGESAKDVQEVM